MQVPEQREAPFIEFLESLVHDERRDALAALRRGLGKEPGEAPSMYPYVVPKLPGRLSLDREAAYYMVAALFASHPTIWHRREGEYYTNLGASMRRVADKTDSGSIRSRFVALLTARFSDLPDHLRSAVALCRAHDVPVDWAQLLRDLQRWEEPDRRVQRHWANAYWREARDPAEAAEETPPL